MFLTSPLPLISPKLFIALCSGTSPSSQCLVSVHRVSPRPKELPEWSVPFVSGTTVSLFSIPCIPFPDLQILPMTGSCGHSFCQDCVKKFANKCPNCQRRTFNKPPKNFLAIGMTFYFGQREWEFRNDRERLEGRQRAERNQRWVNCFVTRGGLSQVDKIERQTVVIGRVSAYQERLEQCLTAQKEQDRELDMLVPTVKDLQSRLAEKSTEKTGACPSRHNKRGLFSCLPDCCRLLEEDRNSGVTDPQYARSFIEYRWPYLELNMELFEKTLEIFKKDHYIHGESPVSTTQRMPF